MRRFCRSLLILGLALTIVANFSGSLSAQNFIYANNDCYLDKAPKCPPWVHKIDLATGNIVHTYKNLSGIEHGRGVAVCESTMYYTTAVQPCVFKYDLALDMDKGCFFNVVDPFGATILGLGSLAYDGTNLWIQAYEQNAPTSVFQYDITSSPPKYVAKFIPAGCTGANVYCDALEYVNIPIPGCTGPVLMANRGDALDPYDAYPILGPASCHPSFINPTDKNSGIAWDGTNFYISDITQAIANNPQLQVFNAGGKKLGAINVKKVPAKYPAFMEDLAIDCAQLSCYNPPNTTMVAWYPFDELAGTTSKNLATGNSGTQVNGPLGISAGKVAGAASFNGTNQFVQSPSSIDTNFGPVGSPFFCNGNDSTCWGNFSIDVWLQVLSANPGTSMTIVDKLTPSPPKPVGYQLSVVTSVFGFAQSLQLTVADGGTPPGYTVYSSVGLISFVGFWHHVAVTVNRTTTPTSVKWYYDGVPQGSTCSPCTDRTGSLLNNSPLRIGRNNTSPPADPVWFQGNMDELEIYNRELTPEEVFGIYDAGPHGKCKPAQ